jgi:hypothetical protein
MRWPSLVALAGLALSLGACDKIPLLGKKKPAAPPPDTTTHVATAPDTAVAPTPPPPPPAAVARVAEDEPWTPTDTGTVSPGMTRDQVIAVWGVPVAERSVEGRTYLYFRNGCEVSCGTFDVVFLENDQVVDAIVRGQGHTYSGISSSPPERQGMMTRPGVPPDTSGAGTA